MLLVKTNITAFGYDSEKFKEVNNTESLTVPDQALTPQELLRRFARGEPLHQSNRLVYDDDFNMNLPEFDKLDKLDRLHEMQENSFNVKELYTEFEDERKKAEAHARNAKQNEVNAPKTAASSLSESSENSNINADAK